MLGHIAFQRDAHLSSDIVRTVSTSRHKSVIGLAILAICCVMLSTMAMAETTTYVQTNIISDLPGTASVTDPTLLNPWGVSVGPAIWIDAANTGLVKADTA